MQKSADFVKFFLFVCGSLLAFAAVAQSYPAKPVRLVVPYPAAGVAEVMSRIIADRISANWGQTVIVDPKPGGNGVIGTEYVLGAAPDGHTWLSVSSGHAAIGGLNPNLRWSPVRDFVAAGLYAQSSSYFVVSSTLPVRDLQEFVALAKSQPGKLNFGHPGIGLTPYLSMALFKRVTGIELQDVPYKGNPQIMADLIPGRIAAAILSSASVIGPARSGGVKVLAVMNARRTKAFPDVPTVAESGKAFAEARVIAKYIARQMAGCAQGDSGSTGRSPITPPLSAACRRPE